MDLDEVDEIVKEIPICHSTRLQKRLYSFRYPLLPKIGHENYGKVIRGYYKPENKEVDLEMAIDVNSPNFDQDRAELIAEEVNSIPDARKSNQKPYFEHNLVDKVRLRGNKPLKDPSKYAAMIYNGREIHLTSLDGVFTFKPTFPHLEKTSGKRRRDVDHNDLSEEEDDISEQVTVKFKQSDDRWKQKANTFQAQEAKSAEEPWTECDYQSESSIISKVEKLKLLSENLVGTGQAANLTDCEYLRVLIPEDQEEAAIEPTLPSHIMSLHELRALPIQEQCRLLLKDAQIIQFQQLMMTLAGGEGLTADLLLKTLPKVAVLVRGNWIVKSEVLYPSNTLSATSGVPAELMCRARDYVLYLFTKNQYVERKKVSSVMKIPSEEVKEIFTGFSRLSHNKGWELALGSDHDFIIKHVELVHRQNEVWEQRFKQLCEFLRDNSKRARRKSKSVSEVRISCSDNDSGTEKQKSPVASRRNPKTSNPQES